ncbi:MAG: TraM recognition domain-containing protein, partial [Acidimicrobiales bacterium]|nr:TraM recognition domain-containing protein [Acidimicrobiales bacterium]
WQDNAQITATYGDRARTVLNNHRAKLYCTGLGDETALDYVSRLVGEQLLTQRNVSTDLHGGRR